MSILSWHGFDPVDDNLALSILRQIEEEGVRRRSREVLVKCPVGISNFIMNQKRDHVAQIEARYGLSVRVEGDPMLVSPDFSIEKFKTATRYVPEAAEPVVSADTIAMDEIDDDIVEEDDIETPESEQDEERKPKRRRRVVVVAKGRVAIRLRDLRIRHMMRPLPMRMQPLTRMLAKVPKRMRQ